MDVRYQNVSKTFGGSAVVDHLNLVAEDGELVVLLGPSGCGKTTTLRMLAGLEDATSGDIFIGSERINDVPTRYRDIAMVFQNYALYPHMTVAENLGFSLRLRGVAKAEAQARIAEVARLLEIENLLGHKPQQLSGGQRQRVALGRAIVRRPKLFLFDEPLSNLDATLRATMRVELAKLHDRLGATMLYVTHDQAEAMTLGETIVVLDQGAVQQRGTPAEIYHRPANTFVAGFVGNPRMNLIDGELETGGMFRSGSLKIDLSNLWPGIAAADQGKNLALGVRGENLIPCDPSDSLLDGEIELVEDLGSDRFIHVKCGSVELITRASGKQSFRKGNRLYLKVNAKDLHLFRQGIRLEPPAR